MNTSFENRLIEEFMQRKDTAVVFPVQVQTDKQIDSLHEQIALPNSKRVNNGKKRIPSPNGKFSFYYFVVF